MAVSLPPILCNLSFECIDAEHSPSHVINNYHHTRIEALANDYIHGKALSIHTASLRGTLRVYARHFESTRSTHEDRKGKDQAQNVNEIAAGDCGDSLERSFAVHKGRHLRKQHAGKLSDTQSSSLRHHTYNDPCDGFHATGHKAMQQSTVHGAPGSKYSLFARSESIQSDDRNRNNRRLSTSCVNRIPNHARYCPPIRSQIASVPSASHCCGGDRNSGISDQLVSIRHAHSVPFESALRPIATHRSNGVCATDRQVASAVICSRGSNMHQRGPSTVDRPSSNLVFQPAGTCDVHRQACCDLDTRFASSEHAFYRVPTVRCCSSTASQRNSRALDLPGSKKLDGAKHAIRDGDLSDSDCEMEDAVSQNVGIETRAGTLGMASCGFDDQTPTKPTAWDQYNATSPPMLSTLAAEKGHHTTSAASGHCSDHWPSHAQLGTSSMEAALRTADAFLGTWNED